MTVPDDQPRSTGSPVRVLGITGPIACGKTTVGDILLSLGAQERIDADAVTHELMRHDADVRTEIAARFGADVVSPACGIDRSALAAKVFHDPAELRALECIVHPRVIMAVRARIKSLNAADTGGVVIVDAVKLMQSEMIVNVDTVWLVQCPPAVQRQRLRAIRRLRDREIEARILAQPRFDPSRVDTIIENGGSKVELSEQVAKAWKALVTSGRH